MVKLINKKLDRDIEVTDKPKKMMKVDFSYFDCFHVTNKRFAYEVFDSEYEGWDEDDTVDANGLKTEEQFKQWERNRESVMYVTAGLYVIQ